MISVALDREPDSSSKCVCVYTLCMAKLLAHLKEKYTDLVSQSIEHPFTSEINNGELDDSILYVYLVMDKKFFMSSVRMLARTASLSDNDDAVIRLGKQVGELCGSESEYFSRTLAELRVELAGKIHAKGEPAMPPEIAKYMQFLSVATESNSYLENITAIYVFEWVYLLWAERADPKVVATLPYKHAEWIRLHRGPDFSAWVNFLEYEVLRFLNSDTLSVVEAVFKRTLELEALFFDVCYNYDW